MYFGLLIAGIEPGLWKQAQADNPDPEHLTPVGVLGFEDLRWRARQQTVENKKHLSLIDRLGEDISSLDRENQAVRAKIIQARHNIVQLEHRLLKVCYLITTIECYLLHRPSKILSITILTGLNKIVVLLCRMSYPKRNWELTI